MVNKDKFQNVFKSSSFFTNLNAKLTMVERGMVSWVLHGFVPCFSSVIVIVLFIATCEVRPLLQVDFVVVSFSVVVGFIVNPSSKKNYSREHSREIFCKLPPLGFTWCSNMPVKTKLCQYIWCTIWRIASMPLINKRRL